jgi:phosphate starvation-inducible PhoH-like protein
MSPKNDFTEEQVKKKRVIKGEIKYKITLSEEQKRAKDLIFKNQVTVLYGKPGTSKTAVACISALDLLHRGEVNRITLLRPVVATENIGFLPGGEKEKMLPWFSPIIENLYDIYDRNAIEKHMEEKRIRFLPLQYTQGINLKDEIAIFDEAENATKQQITMVITRLCYGSKLVLTGDVNQIQLRNENDSGFAKLISLCNSIDDMCCMELTENRRAKIVQDILEKYT